MLGKKSFMIPKTIASFFTKNPGKFFTLEVNFFLIIQEPIHIASISSLDLRISFSDFKTLKFKEKYLKKFLFFSLVFGFLRLTFSATKPIPREKKKEQEKKLSPEKKKVKKQWR